MLRNLLTYRLIILNSCGVALAFWAWQQGFVLPLFETDTSRITYIIAGLFLVGMFSVAIRARKISALLNASKAGRPQPINGVKLLEKAAHLDAIAGWLVSVGLLGTVIGFAMALSGVSDGDIASPAGVQAITKSLMDGMFVAISTTIVGAVCALWIEVNIRILKTATVSLIEDAR